MTPDCREFVSRGKHGYMDISGRAVIPPQFDEAIPFTDCGLANVMVGDRWGYIDTSGDWVIPPRFEDCTEINNGTGLAIVQTGGQNGCIDASGNMVIEAIYHDIEFTDSDHALMVKKDGKWGYITTRDQWIGDYVVS